MPQNPTNGSKGLVFTTGKNKVDRSIKQLIDLLERIADPITPSSEKTENENLSLEEELKLLKENKKCRFRAIKSNVIGNCFIEFKRQEDDPIDLYCRIFDRMKEIGGTVCRDINKLWPILHCGFNETNECIEALKPFIQKAFNCEPLMYEIFIHRKHHDPNVEPHDSLNKKIMDLVDEKHTPVYIKKNPSMAIIWIQLGRNIYLGTCPRWTEFCCGNVVKYCTGLNLTKDN